VPRGWWPGVERTLPISKTLESEGGRGRAVSHGERSGGKTCSGKETVKNASGNTTAIIKPVRGRDDMTQSEGTIKG